MIIVAIGLLWPWLPRVGLGRLPGEIVVERENVTHRVDSRTGFEVLGCELSEGCPFGPHRGDWSYQASASIGGSEWTTIRMPV
ncbi:DUF2905 domain-containing protein [Mesorhizobium sp. M0833]|uniref:DUF2905 domain-containing protein n=1 Tax=Mesorhizobium sp. M0833 TaxID=2957009 RepID=UPI003338365D